MYYISTLLNEVKFLNFLSTEQSLRKRIESDACLLLGVEKQKVNFKHIENSLNYQFSYKNKSEKLECKVLIRDNTLIIDINEDLAFSLLDSKIIHYNVLSRDNPITHYHVENGGDTSTCPDTKKFVCELKNILHIDITKQEEYKNIILAFYHIQKIVAEKIKETVKEVLEKNFSKNDVQLRKNISLKECVKFIQEYHLFARQLKKKMQITLKDQNIDRDFSDMMLLLYDNPVEIPEFFDNFIKKSIVKNRSIKLKKL